MTATDEPAGWRPLGEALLDYHNGNTGAQIVVSSELWEDEPTPVSAYYRPTDDPLPDLEREALSLCRGRVLDFGAGAGRHTLELQNGGHQVVALDLLENAVHIMRDRGVVDARCGGLDTLTGEKFDTVLMLMHGLGVVGDLHGLGRLLEELPTLLNPGGRLVCDSADLAAVLDEEAPDLMGELATPDRYPGEIEFRLHFNGIDGSPYRWLFVDPETLGLIAGAAGFDCRIAATGARGSFTAVLTLRHSES